MKEKADEGCREVVARAGVRKYKLSVNRLVDKRLIIVSILISVFVTVSVFYFYIDKPAYEVHTGAVHFINMGEAQTLGYYSKAYREYMKRTPRWVRIPKSQKED